MFTENDFLDNRTIKRAGRIYGKPVFILDGDSLKIENYPCAAFQRGYYSYIEHDGKHARKVKGTIKYDYCPFLDKAKDWFREHFIIFELLAMKKARSFNTVAEKEKTLNIAAADMNGVDIVLLRNILAEMKKINPNIIFTSFTKGEINRYREVFCKIADELGIRYIDISGYFSANEIYSNPFNSHWNIEGHAQAAEGLYKELKPMLSGFNKDNKCLLTTKK
jgi:hypothetical protein